MPDSRAGQVIFGACLIHSPLLYRAVIGLFMMGTDGNQPLVALGVSHSSSQWYLLGFCHQLRRLTAVRVVA